MFCGGVMPSGKRGRTAYRQKKHQVSCCKMMEAILRMEKNCENVTLANKWLEDSLHIGILNLKLGKSSSILFALLIAADPYCNKGSVVSIILLSLQAKHTKDYTDLKTLLSVCCQMSTDF